MIMNIINDIGSSYSVLKNINSVIGSVLSAMLIYKTVYFLIGIFFTRKFKPAKKKHKYAIVIAARNEEAVIGNLLDSIWKQDYPKELLTVFVVADNCNDNTSGVVTLLELMATVDEEDRDTICFIFFDNEEKGLIGSGAFRKQYASKVVDKVLVNFDCVGDGDTLLMKYNSSMSQSKYKILSISSGK